MPWSEDEFRRALEGAAERARPAPEALGMLRARARRRERTRVIGLAFAGAAAVTAIALIAVSLRSEPAPQDVEFAAPASLAASPTSAPPAISEQADGGSILAEISGDGRFVVFMSEASNLVPGDTNDAADTFVRDLSTGTLERVSVSSAEEEGDAASLSASISSDGRFVAFRSHATNLVEGDTNGVSDIFLRDRSAGTTTRVSVASGGLQANGESDSASVSGDGRFIAFRSAASNLVANDSNRVPDVFVHDLASATTQRVSVASDGRQSNGDSRTPQISGDGRWLAFASAASSLVRDDTNRTWDVFVHDLGSGTTERVSIGTDRAQANGVSTLPSISADGREVAFVSEASNLVRGDTNRVRDAFVRDRSAGTTERVSIPTGGGQANAATLSAALSGDGRFIALSSDASNLVATDRNRRRDIFILDRSSGLVTLVSTSSDGRAADGDSGGPSVSFDGRFVAFQSYATTLSAGDENGVRDIFVHDTASGTTGRASVGSR